MAGDKSRFVRRGGKVPADGSDPGAIVLLHEADDPAATEWGVRQVSAGFALDIDPVPIVDSMSRALLDHIRAALMSGQRPDGGGEQKALGVRAASDPDRESPHRGFNTGILADELRRTPIKSTGDEASSTIYPPTSRTAYVAAEKRRGVVLLTSAGAAGKAAADAAREAVGVILGGDKVIARPAEVTARDADK
jgi:hypothetical protein